MSATLPVFIIVGFGISSPHLITEYANVSRMGHMWQLHKKAADSDVHVLKLLPSHVLVIRDL